MYWRDAQINSFGTIQCSVLWFVSDLKSVSTSGNRIYHLITLEFHETGNSVCRRVQVWACGVYPVAISTEDCINLLEEGEPVCGVHINMNQRQRQYQVLPVG